MKYTLSLILSALFINACAMNSSFSAKQILTVDYIQTADAKADAQKAIESSDFTLIGFDQRGLVIPGVTGKNLEQAKKNCSVFRLNGMGDVVRSKSHLAKMQNVHSYSLKYNAVILDASSCHKNSTQQEY